jgi:hypothetical protein
MRHILIGAGLSISLILSAHYAAAGDLPQRKPGYWEITTVAPVSGMTKTKVCVGPDDNIVRPEGSDCTEPMLTPLNEGFIVDVLCTSAEGKQTISTTFTGDFDTRYHAILKTTFDPPVGAISHMGVNIDGKYLGPDCPDDAKAAAAE